MTTARRRLGALGEDMVAEWYRTRGYQVVDRNWRCRHGELDLVLTAGGVVVICEVKTRSSNAFGTPAEAVTRVKQLRLRALAARWLGEQRRYLGGHVRFDVASVMGDRVEVVEAAF